MGCLSLSIVTGLPNFIQAEGVRLVTDDGRVYLDIASGFESAVAGAVQDALAEHLLFMRWPKSVSSAS